LQELKSVSDAYPTTSFVFVAGLVDAGQSEFVATLARILPKKTITCSAAIERSILMTGNVTTPSRTAELYRRIAAAAQVIANATSPGSMHRVVLVNTCLGPGPSFPIDIDNDQLGGSMTKHPNLLMLHDTFAKAGLDLKVLVLLNSLRLASMFAREPPGPDPNGRVRVIADNLRILAFYLTEYPGEISCVDAGEPTSEAAHGVANLLGIPPLGDHGDDLLQRMQLQLQKRDVAGSSATAQGAPNASTTATALAAGRPVWVQSSIIGTWQTLKNVCTTTTNRIGA